jgi:Flp pilus assembly protein TadG
MSNPAGERERGQALALTTLFLTVIMGFLALVLDIGSLIYNKQQLQNAADAATLAGAWRLPLNPTQAEADAITWATRNNATAAETDAEAATTTDQNDTMRATVTRPWEFTVGKVLGLTGKTITATAEVRLRTMTGVNTTNPRVFPYAVWGGNVPRGLSEGTRVTFKANNWRNQVKPITGCDAYPQKNCNWQVTSNDFKGYFHWQDGTLYVKPVEQTFSQGGNAVGTADEEARMRAYQAAGIPIVLPVVGTARNDSGTGMYFTIIAWVCVQVDPMGNSSSSDWTGLLTRCTFPGYYDGPNQPAGDVPKSYVPTLVK